MTLGASHIRWTTSVPLFGRQLEVGGLLRGLGEGRSPVLVRGEGGVGKTALLCAFAEAARLTFGWRTATVTLRPRMTAEQVEVAVSRGLHSGAARLTPARRRERLLADILGPPLIVVVRVITDEAPWAGSPAAQWLGRVCTAGWRCYVEGDAVPDQPAARVLTVPSLATDAARLLFECALAGRAPLPAAEVIDELCTLLSGNPFLLKLVARQHARLEPRSLSDLLMALRAHPAAPARAAACVRAALSTHSDLQGALRAWAEIAGPCPAPLALMLLGCSAEALEQLLDAGLVRRVTLAGAGGGSGLMEGFELPAAVRALLLEPAAAPLTEAGQRRRAQALMCFLEYVVNRTTDLDRATDLIIASWADLRAFESEVEDPVLRQGLRFQLGMAAFSGGYVEDAQALLQRITSQPEPGATPVGLDDLRVKALGARCQLLRGQAEEALQTAEGLLTASIDDALGADLLLALGELCLECGALLLTQGSAIRACTAYRLAAAARMPGPVREEALLGLGQTLLGESALKPAIDSLEAALRLWEASGAAPRALVILAHLTQLTLDRGLPGWEGWAQRTLDLAFQHPQAEGAPQAILRVAECYLSAGRADHGRAILSQALGAFPQPPAVRARILLLLARCALRQGDLEAAGGALEEAIPLCAPLAEPDLQAEVLHSHAIFLLHSGAPDQAQAEASRAFFLRLTATNLEALADDLGAFTAAAGALGHKAVALRWLSGLLPIAEELCSPFALHKVLRERGQRLLTDGATERALVDLDNARRLARALGLPADPELERSLALARRP